MTRDKEAIRKYNEEYKNRPKVKARAKEKEGTNERKAIRKAYRESPEGKAVFKAYRQSPKYKAKAKQYYQEDKDWISKKEKIRYENNKIKINERHKQWAKNNKKKVAAGHKRYYQQNKVRLSELQKQYSQKNKIKIAATRKEWQQKNKTKLNQYFKTRRKNDSNFAIAGNLRNRFNGAFKLYSTTGKIMSSKEYDIDYEAIFKHIGSKPNDTEDWHIDHIKPLCLFDFNDPEQIKIASAPENHQWLLAEDNLSKGAKWTSP